MKVETTALSIKHIAQMYCVNGKHFADLYRNKISGYAYWCELTAIFAIRPKIRSFTPSRGRHRQNWTSQQ